ncbi:MAG: hypothetical protein M3O33_16555, partial [Cyanobacteriota bacterium]|nr:hypothetical protein [Cyanobacteriota bacterium]
VNHPSYQERGGLNNKNRRSRRRRLDEPVGREEIISKGSQRPTPVLQLKSESLAEADSVNVSVSEAGRDSAQVSRDSAQPSSLTFGLGKRHEFQQGDREAELPRRASDAKRGSSNAEELGLGARGSGLDLGERVGKPQLVKSPRETEPPEVIAIEMSPEEQDVYALMGISPLVRLNREVKNPKSVILSVVLPGESNQAETSNQAVAESLTETASHDLASDNAGVSELEEVTFFPTETPTADALGMAETVLVTSSAETSAPDLPTDSLPDGGSDSSGAVIRRRRRRSSAMDSEDFTAE